MRRMSASVRISALSSSTTSTRSGSARVSNCIEHSSDFLHRKWLLQVGVNPLARYDLADFFRGVRSATIDDEGELGTRRVKDRHRHPCRNGTDVEMQQHGDR